MKIIDITEELRNKIIKKLNKLNDSEPAMYYASSSNRLLLDFYKDKQTINEKNYKELCGII